ncbi:hypothetical protein D3C85_1496750 [compost metagenome]
MEYCPVSLQAQYPNFLKRQEQTADKQAFQSLLHSFYWLLPKDTVLPQAVFLKIQISHLLSVYCLQYFPGLEQQSADPHQQLSTKLLSRLPLLQFHL